VENSRNPDIYTREFVELVMRYNQQQKGRSDAYAQFRDILGREMASAIPEIREDVKKIVESSGGQISA
jgi:mediator of RNA polymerase II transcription subunit 10